MEFDEFHNLASSFNVIPVYKKIPGDLLTPVLAYLRIRSKQNFSFILESIEGIGKVARYSFIGKDPISIIQSKCNKIIETSNGKSTEYAGDIFDFIKSRLKKFNHAPCSELPDFNGGIVGYFSFESISQIEPVIIPNKNDELDLPDVYLGIFNLIIAFDHFTNQIIIINNVETNGATNYRTLYDEAVEKIDRVIKEIFSQRSFNSNFEFAESETTINKENFHKTILKIKNNIYEGDVFQLVISERFSASYTGELLNVYRALRIINPSPYMYFLELPNNTNIIGTSPEDLLKVKNKEATILPIAGTRKRGKNRDEDLAMEEELLNDPKELAEHVMLVDLARNDLGRVCDYDTVKIVETKKVQRYSHVMHIVSRVVGKLKDGFDSIDALKASFPAGTVSGAPKIRAIQLINEYENYTRNIYSGAVGYIDFSGNLDLCIAIRTLFTKGNTIYWQAGAGIVSDSKPELELKEIINKSAALKSALKYAEVIDENTRN